MEMDHTQKIARIAQLELAMQLMNNEIARRQAEANRVAAETAFAAHLAQVDAAAKPTAPAPTAPTPTPTTAPAADRWPTAAELQAFARAPRTPQIPKVIDAYVHSPGATVRIR